MPKLGITQTRSKYYVTHVPWSIWEAIIDHACDVQEDPTIWTEKMLVSAAKIPPRDWVRDKRYIPLLSGRGEKKALRFGPESKAALKLGVKELGGSVGNALQVMYWTGLKYYAFKRLREHRQEYQNASHTSPNVDS